MGQHSTIVHYRTGTSSTDNTTHNLDTRHTPRERSFRRGTTLVHLPAMPTALLGRDTLARAWERNCILEWTVRKLKDRTYYRKWVGGRCEQV